jgi:hypothetical protein
MPVDTLNRIIAFHFDFVTDANVATRQLYFRIQDASGDPYTIIFPTTIPASSAAGVNIAPGLPFSSTTAVDYYLTGPMPPDIILDGNGFLIVQVDNMQAGDHFVNIYTHVHQWRMAV